MGINIERLNFQRVPRNTHCLWLDQVAEWQNERLPSDQISVENGGIITQCQRWPLMVDPQLQGVRLVYDLCFSSNQSFI